VGANGALLSLGRFLHRHVAFNLAADLQLAEQFANTNWLLVVRCLLYTVCSWPANCHLRRSRQKVFARNCLSLSVGRPKRAAALLSGLPIDWRHFRRASACLADRGGRSLGAAKQQLGARNNALSALSERQSLVRKGEKAASLGPPLLLASLE